MVLWNGCRDFDREGDYKKFELILQQTSGRASRVRLQMSLKSFLLKKVVFIRVGRKSDYSRTGTMARKTKSPVQSHQALVKDLRDLSQLYRLS